MNYSFYDEMDELDDILTESTDEEIFIEFMEELFEEKATQMEYAMRRFKDKYKFNPKDSTIEVDGKRYKCNLDINKPIVYIQADPEDPNTHKAAPRTTCFVQTKNGEFILDKNFFRLKNDKRRDAILQHEVGHSKLHNKVPDNTTADRSKISKTMIMNELEKQEDMLFKTYMRSGLMSEKESRGYVKMFHDNTMRDLNKYINMSTASEMQDKIRAKAREAANKYVPKYRNDGIDRSHSNPEEFEADRYSTNRTNERDFKRGLRESMRKASKPKEIIKQANISGRAAYANVKAAGGDARGIKPTKKNGNEYMKPVSSQKEADEYNTNLDNIMDGKQAYSPKDAVKNANKSRTIDYNVRSKALKDKELRNNSSLK